MRYLFADCLLDTQRYLLRRTDQTIRLRPKVFHVLAYLLTHRDRVIPKQELCEQVWSAQAVSDATIENCLKAIRQAIGDTGQAQRLIETRYSQGYRFVAQVTLVPNDRTSEASRAVSTLPTSASVASEDVPVASDCVGQPQDTVPRSMDDRFPAGEWKVVTVLCCALVASRVQGKQRCLETLHSWLRALHELAHQEAQRYGGMCRALDGTRVLIVFGAPVAHEDHAQRAVLAAWGILRHLAGELGTGGNSDAVALRVRMGLHTGRAAVGTGGAAQEMGTAVMGDTVTRAVVLQECAASGTILCSEATARLVQRVARLKARSVVPAHGESTPQNIYQLLGQRLRYTPAVARVARVETPFVGRTRELATLHTVWTQVTRGQGQVVSVMGEAGMGKSRLVAAFCSSLRGAPHTCIQGSCLSYSQALAYQPVLSLLRHACGITEVDRPGVIAAKVQHCLKEVGIEPAVATPYLLHLLGSDAETERLVGLRGCPETFEPHSQAFKPLSDDTEN